ncbi:MAG: hypothetical protein ACXVCO_16550 [Ktedonobacterales bacterium]
MWNGREGGDPQASRGGRGPRDPRGGQRDAPPGMAGASGRYPNPPNSSNPPGALQARPGLYRPPNAANPYRPYGEATSARMPVPYAGTGYNPSVYAPSVYGTSVGMPAAPLPADHHHRLGIAIFHDGNPGHLWRGSVASQLGEATLGAGVIMWLAALLYSPLAVALAVAAMGLPFLITGPLAAPFENVEEPRGGLRILGWLRILLTVVLFAMHFLTILPVVYLVLFGISLCGRLHDALRTAAIRSCLAPGEPESVANDLHIGGVVASVFGPLLATLVYILNGERILALSIVCAVVFLISVNSESFLDALPSNRRAFLLATPESVAHDDTASDDDGWDDDDALDASDEDNKATGEYDDPADRREMKLPEWYQQGPKGAGQVLGDIRAGLGLAGTSGGSTAAMWGLAALALAGGGLAALEVFYVTGALQLPTFYLGPLLAAEGAGGAFGVLIAKPFAGRGWRIGFLGGIIGSGVVLMALGRLPQLPVALGLFFALGLANALALAGAHRALTHNFTPLERRALAAAENWAGAFCGLAGTLILMAFYEGSYLSASGPNLTLHLPNWPIASLISLLGAGLVAAAILTIVAMSLNFSLPKRKTGKDEKASSGTKGRVPGSLPAMDNGDASDYLPALDGESDEWDDGDGWDDAGGDGTGYRSAQYPATGYDDAYGYDDYEVDDGPPARSPRRQPKGRQPRTRH